jgi:acetyl esterase
VGAEHVDELGGDPDRLAVAGDSAGGNLAAAVTLAARDEGPRLAAQLLLYPGSRLPGTEHPSRSRTPRGLFLTADDMRWFGDAVRADSRRCATTRAPQCSSTRTCRLPAAVRATAEYDPSARRGRGLRRRAGEGRLEGGRPRYDGLIHGFFGLGPSRPRLAAAHSSCAPP